jgi:hypothetical protein
MLTQALTGVATHMARKFLIEQSEDPDRVAEETIAFVFTGFGITPEPEPVG